MPDVMLESVVTTNNGIQVIIPIRVSGIFNIAKLSIAPTQVGLS